MKPERIQHRLRKLAGWRVETSGHSTRQSIVRRVYHATYRLALAFVERLGRKAARFGQRPEIVVRNEGRTVEVDICLSRGGETGLLEEDFDFAEEVQGLIGDPPEEEGHNA